MIALLFKLTLSFIVLFFFTAFTATVMYNESDDSKMRKEFAPFLDRLSGRLFMFAVAFGALWLILLIWTVSFGS